MTTSAQSLERALSLDAAISTGADAELVRTGLREALRWAASANFTVVDSCNPVAHRPQRENGGGHHLVLRKGRTTVTVEVSTFGGETQVRSEIERLLRRLGIPRSSEARSWPAGRHCVVVPLSIAAAILSKARPRRCAYWVLAQSDDHFVIEVLPVSGDEAVADRSPVGHPSQREWDSYWATRTVGQDAHSELFPVSESVFLRHLLEQSRPEVVERTARILCVGNGISCLPHALAAAGFPVTVLDLSRVAIDHCRKSRPAPGDLAFMFGLATAERELESYEDFFRPDGSTVWVHGDLFDPDVCPGEYDIIVLTRCLEVFSEFEMRVAISRIDDRLAPNGWCWVVIQNSGFAWIQVQRAFDQLGYAVVPYAPLPAAGKAMAGGLTSG